MSLVVLLAAIALGYIIGLLQNGININDNRTPEIETDEEGKPKYNESISALDEEQRHWIDTHR